MSNIGQGKCENGWMSVQEYKMHNADILFKDDSTVDDLIDVIEGNRRYIRCLYVYNKIDVCSIEEIDEIARRPNSIPASAGLNMNMDGLLAAIWEQMGLVRVYTKKVSLEINLIHHLHFSKKAKTWTIRSSKHADMLWDLQLFLSINIPMLIYWYDIVLLSQAST